MVVVYIDFNWYFTYSLFLKWVLFYSYRDHEFDSQWRTRLAGIESISIDINAIMKGSLGVQWEKARLNYSKRIGIDY